MSIKDQNLCLPIVISTEEQSSFSKLTSQMLEPFCLFESRIGAFFTSGRFRLTLFYRLFVGDPFASTLRIAPVAPWRPVAPLPQE